MYQHSKTILNPQEYNNIPRDHKIFQPPKYLKQPDYIPLVNGLASLQLSSAYNSNVPTMQVFQSTKKLQHMNCIIELNQTMGGLYIGDIISTVKPGIMESGKIQALLSCNFQEDHFQKTARTDLKLITKIIDAKDNLDYPIQMHFPASFQFIETNRKLKKNVLVNCHAGKSRSGTIVCAYLMKKNKWTAQRSLNFIRNKRDRVKPNNGFWQKLLKYQQQVLGDFKSISNNILGQNYLKQQSRYEIMTLNTGKVQRYLQKSKLSRFSQNQKERSLKEQAINLQFNKKQDFQKISLKNDSKNFKYEQSYINAKSSPNLNILTEKTSQTSYGNSYNLSKIYNNQIHLTNQLYLTHQSIELNKNYPNYNFSNYTNDYPKKSFQNIYKASNNNINYLNSDNYMPYSYHQNNDLSSNYGDFHYTYTPMKTKLNQNHNNLYYTQKNNEFNRGPPIYSQFSNSAFQNKSTNFINDDKELDVKNKLFDRKQIKLGQKIKKKFNYDGNEIVKKKQKIQQ